ncbi:sensor histidine kinase [Paenibacillus tarimensis]|uniref:sensor histidine kinase n=1 Tax=Paenibacillus tarimensis TaxID=416012 RepID=UPI001F1A9614|nr:HAMP domain-containing sensor histidine kinase [Paenibacillus tarimensis]MCF2943523.1 HAMP domain-containing histidine kinase [Paenibacillus tarimensis]
MNIRRKLTLRFILQLAAAGGLVLVIAAAAIYWMLLQYTEISLTKDFATIGLESLVETSRITPEGSAEFDPDLLKQVEASGGWLQSLDENGRVIASYHVPDDVPDAYEPGQLVAYWNGSADFPYRTYLWIREKNGVMLTLLYGVPDAASQLLKATVLASPAADRGELVLPAELKQSLQQSGASLLMLDRSGAVEGVFGSRMQVPERFSPQELALQIRYPERYGFDARLHYNEESGQTLVLRIPLNHAARNGEQPLVPEEARIVLTGAGVALAAMLLLFGSLALWNARNFGLPMIHMLSWLEAMGSGRYDEPEGRKGQPRSRKPGGGWRSGYRVYADVLQSLSALSMTLKRNDEERARTEAIREEWIAGVTHDLKTPLSSVSGFSHMLAAEQYDWSAEEVRSFAAIMVEKTAYMDRLVSDLSLTSQLKSGARPPASEPVELNAFVENAVKQAVSHPRFDKSEVCFLPAPQPVTIHTYTPWLQRIVDNLTANALLHNPPGTMLTISLHAESSTDRIVIRFEDNGSGMSEEVAARLFDRYFRGTDTDSPSEGSGLGMAIAKGLVEAMGGTIAVETAKGRGTAIKLSFA